jgi:hypothetical protein
MGAAIAAAVAGAVVSGGIAAASADDYGAEEYNKQAADAEAQRARIAGDMYAYYKQYYRPLETQLIEDVKGIGTAEDQEREAGAAQAEVAQSFKIGRKNIEREHQARGVDPGSPAATTAMDTARLAEAGAQSAAGYGARLASRDRGIGLRFDMINAARGTPTQAAAQFGAAANSYFGAANAGWRQEALDQYSAGQAVGPIFRAASDWFREQRATPKSSAGSPSSGGQTTPFGGIGTVQPSTSFPGVGGVNPSMSSSSAASNLWLEHGGPVRGPGTGTSDSVDAVNIDTGDDMRLSNGEFVLPASVVRRVGEEKLERMIEQHGSPEDIDALHRRRGWGVKGGRDVWS